MTLFKAIEPRTDPYDYDTPWLTEKEDHFSTNETDCVSPCNNLSKILLMTHKTVFSIRKLVSSIANRTESCPCQMTSKDPTSLAYRSHPYRVWLLRLIAPLLAQFLRNVIFCKLTAVVAADYCLLCDHFDQLCGCTHTNNRIEWVTLIWWIRLNNRTNWMILLHMRYYKQGLESACTF